jgi:three-Cys-motif partner protein
MFELEPPADDGLVIPKVGEWSAHKHYFLRRYIDVFTTGMKNRGWSGLHYIDLFASAGIEQLKSDGSLEWGSPLIAAQAPNQFARLHLCELKQRRFDALAKRIERFPQPTAPQLIRGDANVAVHEITQAIPEGTLSLAFLDPTGLHLHFETLRVLASANRRIDLVIFFPDHLDALRNWKINLEQPDSNLDRVLGTGEWRSRAEGISKARWGEMLRKLYQQQIRTLGYESFDVERISIPTGQPLYVLMFASKHERGGDFWRKIAGKKPSGQRSFDW